MSLSYKSRILSENPYAKFLLYTAAVSIPLFGGFEASIYLNNSAYFGGGVGISTAISIAAPSLKKLLS